MSNADFVRNWMNAVDREQSAADLAQALGKTPSAISRRAKTLRGKGVKLPPLRDGRETEVSRLNTMIEHYGKTKTG
tara:strand:- start:751 stop:978 length:228 start_codon:yes stop_codon:yes gene_type:complete